MPCTPAAIFGIMLKGALMTGKVCTTVLFITLILMLMIPDIPKVIVYSLTIVDIGFMSLSFVDYLITYISKANRFQLLDSPENDQ